MADPEPKFTEAVLGPDDFLLLMPRDSWDEATLAIVQQQIPPALKDRVLVVEHCDAIIARRVGSAKEQTDAVIERLTAKSRASWGNKV